MNQAEKIKEYLGFLTTVDRSGYYEWLIENGEVFTAQDLKPFNDSEIEQIYPTPKMCFYNAYKAATAFQLDYFVGYYLPTNLFPMEHAFNYSAQDNKILDPTVQEGAFEVDAWFGIKVPIDQVEILSSVNPLQEYYRKNVYKNK